MPTSIVLLVQNQHGYENLLRLLAIAYGESVVESGPRIGLADLAAHAGGLILLTGGADGPVGQLLLDGKEAAAGSLLQRLADAFAGRCYVELQRHGLESEAADRAGLP